MDIQQNAAGQIAIKFPENREHVSSPVRGNKQYLFRTQAAFICMAWVDPADVEAVMALTVDCGCGKPPKKYMYATALDVLRWTTNNAGATL